jgi:RND family efflux transporter MFP subunit
MRFGFGFRASDFFRISDFGFRISPSAVAALAVLALALSGCKPAARPEKPLVVRCVKAAPAGPALLAGRSQYVGILRGHLETDLSFKVDGTLELIGPAEGAEDWHEGVPVRKGELLARLTPRDFKAAVADANARLVLNESVLKRTQELKDSSMVAQQELDLAIANRNSSQAALDRAEQSMKDSEIVAPYAGVIAARLAHAGETVIALASRPVLRVADQSSMAIDLGVPDKLIGGITTGMKLPVRISAREGLSLTGAVTEVGVSAKPGTRLFKVVVELSNTNGWLKAGMSATVDCSPAQALPAGAVVVPLSALVGRAASNGPAALSVFVAADGRVREKRVETGDLIGSSIIITSGLKPGDEVVTAGAGTLFDGAAVEARRNDE